MSPRRGHRSALPMRIARCPYGCGARVSWVRMEVSGKNVPVDPDLTDAGNVVVKGDPNRVRVTGRIVPPGKPIHEYEDRYMTHYATCAVYAEQQGAASQPPGELDQVVPGRTDLLDAARTLFDDAEGIDL